MLWSKLTLAGLLLAAVQPQSAQAQSHNVFEVYEGPAAIQEGSGGTRVTKNGIDYWTSGSPPRRYQVIGRLTDKRSEEMDGGHAIGSPKVAKLVKQAGGDAVLVVNQNTVGAGSVGLGSFTGGLASFFMMGSTNTMTVFAVLKYLSPASAAKP